MPTLTPSLILGPIAIIGIAMLIAVGLAFADVYFAVFFAAALMAVPLISIRMEPLLWAGMVLIFLIVGQLQYFGQLSKAFWLAYLFGALLYIRVLVIFFRRHSTGIPPHRIVSNPMTKWIVLFFVTAAVSTVANASPLPQVIIAIKEYLFLWSVLIVLAMGTVSPEFLDRMWKGMLWLVTIHVPVVVYQRFVVAAGRSLHGDVQGFDAVVGLFGGSQATGGATGGMGIFLTFAVLLAVSFWREKRLRLLTMIAIVVMAIACIAIAEIKLIVLLMPLSIALLYRNDILRRPVQSFVMLLAVAAVSGMLMVAYQLQYATAGSGAKGPFDYIQRAIERNTEVSFYNPRTGEIGRIASLKFWWNQHDASTPVQFMIGHGIGASRYGTVMGEVAAKNTMYRIDRSTAVVFLWETGLLGTLAFVGFLVSAASFSMRLLRADRITVAERSALSAIAPMLVLQLPVLFYNNELNAQPATQLLLMLMIGQVLFTARRISTAAFSAKHASPTSTLATMTPTTGKAIYSRSS